MRLAAPAGFDFDRTVRSHGWYDLPPFEYDRSARTLAFAFDDGDEVVEVQIRAGARGGLGVQAWPEARLQDAVLVAADVLRLHEDLGDARRRFAGAPHLAAALDAGGGRLLRAPFAFEDVVKTLCTTNCTWALTRTMVHALVANAGRKSQRGRRAFPTAAVLARKPLTWFRDTARAGYRAPYLRELAGRVARGDDLSFARDRTIASDAAARRLGSLKGFGPYATESVLRLGGHYDRLAIDSWCRAEWKALYPRRARGAGDLDGAIARFYAPYSPYAGLALWLDLTRAWFTASAPADPLSRG